MRVGFVALAGGLFAFSFSVHFRKIWDIWNKAVQDRHVQQVGQQHVLCGHIDCI